MNRLLSKRWILLLFLIAACGDTETLLDVEQVREDTTDPAEKTDENPVVDDPIVEPDPTDNNIQEEDCTENCFQDFPAIIVDTTNGGSSDFDRYSCAPETDESGPERIYKLVVETAGFFAAEVTGVTENVDVDLHLLSAESSDACLDRGHLTVGHFVEPGTYFLSVDSWVDDQGTVYAGDFEVSLNIVQASDWTAMGINQQTAEDSLRAFDVAWSQEETNRLEYTITDFSMHSSFPRQWVVQLATGELLFQLHVGHGEGSIVGDDLGFASIFSNTPESHQSSLGMIQTAEIYTGDYGYSMRLDGLEPQFNDNVRPRDIVVHPWDGNLAETIAIEGWVVPSWGCATLDPTISTSVIDTTAEGSLMFFWYPDPVWQLNSTYL